MSGLYFHIPFCKKACTYCDFHFSTSMRGREGLLDAMERELIQRARELGDAPVDTIYFGGGTPSLLEPARIASFLQLAHDLLRVRPDAEVTLEANPDDITAERLAAWQAMGITRLSLGTQSFRADRLAWMGRAHDAEQALRSIALIAHAGFMSWTIDLIYGLPGMTLAEWDEQLTIALDHGMPHLSAYALTVEPRTALAHQVRQGRTVPADDEATAAQFDHLMVRMKAAGLVHYEISNFGRPGHFSRHNSSYWEGVPYLGIGPAAHSFSGTTRRWNVANNARYTAAVEKGEPFSETETLTPVQRTNELLLTGLRTHRGVQLDALPVDVRPRNEQRIVHYVAQGLAQLEGGRLVLTERGRHFADRIAMELFAEA
ncbi:MAG: radical SAM family heme chaperone HemW [Flavobacteriales bacterium]|nr:radical SAM family heme chaperone HemW [Flavobacteriales bacterium]